MLEADARAAAVAELVASNPTIFDSHPDPDVARVLSPGLEGVMLGDAEVSSNRWGMRERAYALPKRDGMVRVVLLGDSFVFGYNAPADERFGVVLEDALRERRTEGSGTVEVLHLGIGSWNAKSACEFARRQLSELDPDLVVQVFVGNDLNDNTGVRGFGVRASFDPARPERVDGRVSRGFPSQVHGVDEWNPLLAALDWESRHRYEEVSFHVGRLARALEERGATYLFLSQRDGHIGETLRSYVEPVLGSGRFAYIGTDFSDDPRYRISAEDGHWNTAGHRRMAMLVFGLVERHGLLTELGLAPWPEAADVVREMHDASLASAPDAEHGFDDVPASLESPRQLYGGVDPKNQVAPYASMILRCGGATSLRVSGRFLDRPELDGAVVRVFLDEAEVHRMPIRSGAHFEQWIPVPDEVGGRAHVTVRFETDDWIYAGPQRRDAVCFRLRDVVLEREDG